MFYILTDFGALANRWLTYLSGRNISAIIAAKRAKDAAI
jgi:hypothetical protein